MLQGWDFWDCHRGQGWALPLGQFGAIWGNTGREFGQDQDVLQGRQGLAEKVAPQLCEEAPGEQKSGPSFLEDFHRGYRVLITGKVSAAFFFSSNISSTFPFTSIPLFLTAAGLNSNMNRSQCISMFSILVWSARGF